jgi:hypothetical protein
MRWTFDDGGGPTTEPVCLCRAIAIAEQRPFDEVADELRAIGWSPGVKGWGNAALDSYLAARGWRRHATTFVRNKRLCTATGKLPRLDDLPKRGPIIAILVSRHAVARIDGVAHDAFDSRKHPKGGPNIVARYYQRDEEAA